MGNSKIVYKDEVLIDLENDTVTPETLAEGVTAHDANGDPIVGTMPTDTVRYGDIPTYHFAESARVVQKIADFKAAHPRHLVFGAASDIHVYNGDATHEAKTKTAVRHAAFALEMVGAMAGCDFIANLGDNCWENGIDTDNALLGAKYSINATKTARERLTCYHLVGNHDTSNSTQKVYDLIGTHNTFGVSAATAIRGFGYTDYADKKVRVIVLNTCDYWNVKGGCGMSYEQKDFLLRALDLSAKSDAASWQILLLSHIPLDWNGGDYNFHADLQAILTAYEDGTTASITVNSSYARGETPSTYATYSGGKLVYNYSGKNAAKIIANIHGHVHTNKVSKLLNTDIARVATVNTNPDLNKSESYPTYGDYSITSAEAAKLVKVSGTAKDTAATFYCIDLDEQIIYAFGYGADVDRTIVYKDVQTYTVTLDLTNVTASNTATVVLADAVYSNTLTPKSGYNLGAVKVTMGGVDITSSVYINGTIKIAQAGSDGNTITGDIVITAEAVAQTSYTNLFKATDADFQNGAVLRSNGETKTGTGFVSGYIAVALGDDVRVRCPSGTSYLELDGPPIIYLYDANKTAITGFYQNQTDYVTFDADGLGFMHHIARSNCAFVRVAGQPTGAYSDFIVTKNEEIK